MKRKILATTLQTALLAVTLTFAWLPSAFAAINYSDLIGDTIFDAYTSMNAAQIDSFLNSFSSSCISTNHGFKAPNVVGYTPADGFKYGSDATAGTIIYNISQVYQISPKVLLATMQKEQGLVTGGSGCTTLRYAAAMGNDCPDSGGTFNYSGFELYSIHGTPVTSVSGTRVNRASSVGFSRQVLTAGWKLKFFRERAEGNVAWNIQVSNFPSAGNSWDNSDDPPTCYNGYMTPGNRARSDSTNSVCSPVISYDGKYTIDSTAVTMTNGATAALYYYDPHISDNTTLINVYTGWFGPPTSICGSQSNATGATSGRNIITNQYNTKGPQNLTFTQLNNTGSKCSEVHVWSPGYKAWASHTATNMPAVSPSSGEIIAANTSGDNRDELMYIKYNGSGGKVEVHTWGNDYHNWAGHVSTPLPTFSPTNGEIIAGDMNGDGHDELMYINYHGTNNRVEVHTFDSTFHAITGHALTDLSGFDPANGEIITGNMDGRGPDELLYVRYNGTNNRVEVHTFGSNYHGFSGHALTDLAGFNPTYNELITGDMNGDGKDELLFIKIKYGGPSGNIEVHTFGSNYHGWANHAITNATSYDPTT